MKRHKTPDKPTTLDLLRALRREQDPDSTAFTVLTAAIRQIEELRIRVEDLQGKLRQGDNGSH